MATDQLIFANSNRPDSQVALTTRLRVALIARLSVVHTARRSLVPIARLRVALIARLSLAHTARLRLEPIGRLSLAHIRRLCLVHTTPANDSEITLPRSPGPRYRHPVLCRLLARATRRLPRLCRIVHLLQ